MSMYSIILVYTLLITVVHGTHFLGGTITWRPLNESATGTPVAIVITQTYLFNYAVMNCTNAMILTNSLVPNYINLANEKLECISNCGSGAVGYTNISVIPRCTDFSIPGETIVGQRSDTVYLKSGDDFSVAFIAGYWRSLATVTSGNWAISSRIEIKPRSDNGLYNNAPVATMMSPIYIPRNKTTIIQIPVADADGDTIRCRWATNTNGIDECSSVCPPGSLPPNTVIYPNCTIVITGTNVSAWYAVAVMVEDFINSTSTAPLSSVPVQFLVQVVNTSSCTILPEVVGTPPDQSCTPVIVGQAFTSELIAINSCGSSVSIADIATLSFAGVIQNSIVKQNSTTYRKSFSWTPTSAQLGYQVMCALAFDSQDSQSAQYCFKFYVSQNTTTDCPGESTTTTVTSTTSSTSTTTRTTSSTSSTTSTTRTTSSTTATTSSTTGTTSSTTATTSSTTATTSSTISTVSSTTATTSSTTTVSSTTETTSSTSTSTTSTSTSTTSTTETSSTSSTSSTTSTSSSSTTSTTASTTSSSSSTSSSSTSTSSTSTSSTSATSLAATTTTSKTGDPINWPLIGSLIGLALLAALSLASCFCWFYIYPLVDPPCAYKHRNKPILYHIERCIDPNCYWPGNSNSMDTPSSLIAKRSFGSTLDTLVDGPSNIERLSSITQTNRALSSNNGESDLTNSDICKRVFSLSSSDHSSHKPFVRISVLKVRMKDRESSAGNPRIKPPNRVTAEEQNRIPSRPKTKSAVRVSRIKSTDKRNAFVDVALDEICASARSRDHIQVTRVRSVSFNTNRLSSLSELSHSGFDDSTIYLEGSDDSKTVSSPSKDRGNNLQLNCTLPQLVERKSESSSQQNPIEIVPDPLPSNPSPASVNSRVRVDRITKRKRIAGTRPSASRSLLLEALQNKTTNQRNTVHVERIPRKNTA